MPSVTPGRKAPSERLGSRGSYRMVCAGTAGHGWKDGQRVPRVEEYYLTGVFMEGVSDEEAVHG